MTKEHVERICEAVFEFTRLQLSDWMNVDGGLSIDDINAAANRTQQELQRELRQYIP